MTMTVRQHRRGRRRYSNNEAGIVAKRRDVYGVPSVFVDPAAITQFAAVLHTRSDSAGANTSPRTSRGWLPGAGGCKYGQLLANVSMSITGAWLQVTRP
jgi:hypothetical protein